MNANQNVQIIGELSAVVTRADGTVEDLGVIASTDANTLTIADKIVRKLQEWEQRIG